jgi:hypothetical protein
MNFRKVLAVSSLALLTAVPFAARADAAGRASDACIQAFIDAYLPKGAVVRVRKEGPAAGPLRVYARQHTIALSAQLGAEGGLITARCVADNSGEVLILDGPTIEKSGAKPGLVATRLRL